MSTRRTRYQAYSDAKDSEQNSKEKVGACICRSKDGVTDDEIALHTGMVLDTAKATRWELWRLGLIRDTGRERLTRHGKPAAVWASVEDPDKVVEIERVQLTMEDRMGLLAAHRTGLMLSPTSGGLQGSLVFPKFVEWLEYHEKWELRKKGLL